MAATETRKKKTLVHISAHTYHLNILKQQPCECPSSGFYKLSHPYWRPDSLKQNQHRLWFNALAASGKLRLLLGWGSFCLAWAGRLLKSLKRIFLNVTQTPQLGSRLLMGTLFCLVLVGCRGWGCVLWRLLSDSWVNLADLLVLDSKQRRRGADVMLSMHWLVASVDMDVGVMVRMVVGVLVVVVVGVVSIFVAVEVCGRRDGGFVRATVSTAMIGTLPWSIWIRWGDWALRFLRRCIIWHGERTGNENGPILAQCSSRLGFAFSSQSLSTVQVRTLLPTTIQTAGFYEEYPKPTTHVGGHLSLAGALAHLRFQKIANLSLYKMTWLNLGSTLAPSKLNNMTQKRLLSRSLA